MAGKKGNIKPEAKKWFKNNRPELAGEDMRATRFYNAKESWTKEASWWFVIPLWLLAETEAYTNWLCETEERDGDFWHLRVPVSYIVEKWNRGELGRMKRKGKTMILLDMSASAGSRFLDLRGSGRVDFSDFQYPPDKNDK